MEHPSHDPATLCVHAGTVIDPHTYGVNTPLYTSTSYFYLKNEALPYPRAMNTPNQQALIAKLCALEHTESGLATSSGMSAISHALLGLVEKGGHVVLQEDLYGGTHHFATVQLERYGIDYTFVKDCTEAGFEAAFRPNTKLLWLETPTNPLLKVIDLEAAAAVAKRHGVLTGIDNTFASPYNQTPADFGIDVVIHSATKYIGGHSDLTLGAILTSKELTERIHHTAMALGGSADPAICHQAERSLKTLHVRMERHNENAQRVAEFLDAHPKVAKVNYPGLPSHPQHELAKRQMKGFGGMLSFELDESVGDPVAFQQRLRLIAPAISLGGVESLITSPKETSHAKMTAEQRAEAGVADGLLRLSVGIEAVGDLIADLGQALGDR